MVWTNMSAGTDYPPQVSIVDGTYRKVNVTVMKDDDKLGKQEVLKESPNIGKPPRHVSSIRHSVSSAQLTHAAELVSKLT